MCTEFKLTEKEEKLAKEFEQEHSHKGIYKGAIGGHIDYIFTPNSIFRGISIKSKKLCVNVFRIRWNPTIECYKLTQ